MRAEKNLRIRRAVGDQALRGTHEKLAEGIGAPCDGAASTGGIVLLQFARRSCMAREDTVAKAGRESLDLSFDRLQS